MREPTSKHKTALALTKHVNMTNEKKQRPASIQLVRFHCYLETHIDFSYSISFSESNE